KPRSLYPHLALDIANLQIMCNECNVSKGNRDEVEWQ
ncbi:HNH endonuclease, partial [Klebsiella pneumoniae]